MKREDTEWPRTLHRFPFLYENEKNPWLAAAARFDEAAKRLKLDDGMRKVLRSPAREITVHIPVQLDDGRLEVFTGYRVQHSIARGPAKGGIRYRARRHARRSARAGFLDDLEMRGGQHSRSAAARAA